MSCPPRLNALPGPGETTSSALPANTFAGKPLPYIASSVLPVIYGLNYRSGQYTSALQEGNMYVSMSTIAAASGKPLQFASNEDRIKYLKGQLNLVPNCS